MIKINKSRSNLYLIIIVIVLITTYINIKLFSYNSEDILMEYAKNKTNIIINQIINDSLNNLIDNNEFDNIITIEKNSNNDIIQLNFDNKIINKISYMTSENIINKIETIDNSLDKNDYFYVPLGVMYKYPSLANLGPKIPFKIKLIGNINNKVETNTKEYGINNSLVQVLLIIQLRLEVILPFKSDYSEVEKNIILDSKIIQGQIPKYYSNMSIKDNN